MAILVVCPGCRKRFNVSEKFAGKTGPCPNCKTNIRIPTTAEEVKIEGAGEFESGGRSATGQLATKPIAFEETKWNPIAAASIGAAAVGALLVTWLAGRAEIFEKYFIARAAGLLLVSPPLVVAGYAFLRDSEALEPYRGKALYLRAAICSLVYVLLWWVYGLLANQVLTGELWSWAYFAPPFFIVGSLAAMFSLDLDFGNGFFHFCFYLIVTVLLKWVGGMGWVWEVTSEPLPGVGG
jgi:hypothetical protein